MSLDKVSTARRVILGSGAVLLIWSFFPWNGWDFGGIGGLVKGASYSWNAWHGMGIVMGLALIALLAWVAVQIFAPQAIPELPIKSVLISLGLGALAVLFGVIRVFEYGARKWEIWIALLLMIALAAGLFLRLQEEGGVDAVK